MLKKSLALMATAGLFASSSFALSLAADGTPPPEHIRSQAQHMSQVTPIDMKEAGEKLDELLKHFDTDASGYLSDAESIPLVALMSDKLSENRLKAIFDRIDANNDGSLSLEEFIDKDSFRSGKPTRDRSGRHDERGKHGDREFSGESPKPEMKILPYRMEGAEK